MQVVKPVKAMTTYKVLCVFYGGAHLFEGCPYNPFSINYVRTTTSTTTDAIIHTIQDGGIIEISHRATLRSNNN